MISASNVSRTPSTPTSPETHQATSSTSSAETRSVVYEVNPKKIEGVRSNRERLAQSENKAARTLGAALKVIHNQLATGEISPQQHKTECTKIREAAERIHGDPEIEKEVLEKFGGNDVLVEFGLHRDVGLTLTVGECTAINADIGWQVKHVGFGLLETGDGLQAARNDADRGRTSLARLIVGVGTAMLEFAQENPAVFAAVALGAMGNVLNDDEAESSQWENQRSHTDSGSTPGQGMAVPQHRPSQGGEDDPQGH